MKTLIASLLLLAGLFGASPGQRRHRCLHLRQRAQGEPFAGDQGCAAPKCQNRDNPADSNAGLAKGSAGQDHLRWCGRAKGEAEVVDYMVARYGTFILYPPDGLGQPDPLAALLVIVIGVVAWWCTQPAATSPLPCNSLKVPWAQKSRARLCRPAQKEETMTPILDTGRRPAGCLAGAWR